ncbi:Ribosome maturation factor RimM [Cocos nucifera]|uniref:Ribosome maturation factor RimM n=1 Tax=Cocos nucifera TaxID=13894 RepID=A0A8K0IAM6_COCNU|nr:Ribosome maturation factor RimM [Cocos nucifera]
MPPRPSLLSPPSPPLSLLPLSRTPLWIPSSFRLPTKTPFDSSSRRFRPVSLPVFSSGAPVVAEAAIGSRGVEEEEVEGSKFLEVGYISTTHGIRGELRVVSSTDFPELRFFKPGRRWLRTRILGKEIISEVELTGGRSHPGKKCWIISFSGIDTVDKAKQMVGSTLLVSEEDRPELEEGEFYTHDLVGMKVVLKETGRLVGTVINVFNYGADDLLEVMPESSKPDLSYHGSHVWVPFVEAIVPDVDMDKREMRITPPRGLLELNLRSDVGSKKERRQLEWKEKKKSQRRLIAAKKKLIEMDQKHLLEGLRFGDKAQKSWLAKQIAEIDFKLLQRAMESSSIPHDRHNLSEFIDANSAVLLKNTMRLSHKYLMRNESEGRNDSNYELHEQGLQLLLDSKAAIILVVNNKDILERGFETDNVCVGRHEPMVNRFEELLLDCKRFLKVEEQVISIPLVIVCPDHEIQLYKDCLSDNEYFGIVNQKVWFLEERKLPIISTSTDQKRNKILLKSPWEILQAPTGCGGLLSLLTSHKVVDDLNEMGIEYVQVCSLDDRSTIGHPLFVGFVSSHGADAGIKFMEGNKGNDEFDLIFSMRFINSISKQFDKLQFCAVPERHVHVEQVENEWITVHPDKPNSYHLHCSIYSAFNGCPLDSICIMHVMG